MKKVVSIFLAAIMLVSCIPFAASAEALRTNLPTIYFRGNSERIIDEDGNQVYDFDFDTALLPDMAKKILPYLAIGLVTDNFDEYYRVFGEEMRKVYDRCLLDENGDPKYGTGISEAEKKQNQREMTTDVRDKDGYNYNYYDFANDWRLDPLATADDVAVYIDSILKTTGNKKVNLICKCLGGDLILAYIAKYGTEKVNAICFGSTVAFGGDIVNDLFSGKLVVTPDTIERFAKDEFIAKVLPKDFTVWLQLINETIALANATGVLGFATDAFTQQLYNRLYKGLVPELVLSTYGTWPGYWTMVTADNYKYTRNFVFGKPGSDRYEQYKGLIAKLDNYDAVVRQNIPELLKQAEANGVKIGIVSKYGFQMPPVLKSADEQGDVWTTARYSSLGGTLSKIGKTFPERHIAERTALGYGKYIAPDKQVDASTCLFPDYTWFIKGAVHDDWTVEEDRIIIKVCNSEEQPTVDSFERFPQFMVYDRATDTVSPMTKDNANTEHYEVDAKPTPYDTLIKFFKWLTTVLNILSDKIKASFTPAA